MPISTDFTLRAALLSPLLLETTMPDILRLCLDAPPSLLASIENEALPLLQVEAKEDHHVLLLVLEDVVVRLEAE